MSTATTVACGSRAWLGCLERLRAAPGETLFIDDSALNVAGAERAGLAAHRFEDRDRLAAALEDAGLAQG